MESKWEVVEIEGLAADDLISLADRGEPVILARGGAPVAALIDVAILRSLTDERELLRRLALGELESAAGEGEELASVLEDCRLLLEEN